MPEAKAREKALAAIIAEERLKEAESEEAKSHEMLPGESLDEFLTRIEHELQD